MSGAGFIGLGWMGDPMSRNIVKAGFELTVYDIRKEAVEGLAEAGAVPASDVKSMSECDPVFIIVQTGDQAAAVIDELAQGMEKGIEKTIVLMSTVTPKLVKDLATKYEPMGMRFLDAPVSGAPIVAQLGTLSIMVGGDESGYQKALPYFEAMGESIVHLGGLGAGLTMKLVNNLVALANAYILPEALRLGLAGGLDAGEMVKVIKASSGSNWLVENWPMYITLLSIVANDPAQQDNFELIAGKDLKAVTDWVEEIGVDSPIAGWVRSIVEEGKLIDSDLFGKISTAKVD